MRYRVTLTDSVLGSLILTKMPKGIDDISPTIKRGENHGLTIETDVKLEFYCNGAGKEFIDSIHETQGVDAQILITIEAFCGCAEGEESPDYSIDYSDDYGSFIGGTCDEDFQEFYLGELEMITWESQDEFTKVNIKPRGILETVKNRLDTKVDLFATETMDGTAISPYTYGPYDLTLHSKKIIVNTEFIQDASRLELDRYPGPGLSTGDKFAYPLTAPVKYELDETREPVDFEPGLDYPILYSGAFYPSGVSSRAIDVDLNLIFDATWFAVAFQLLIITKDSGGSTISSSELAFFGLDEINPQNVSHNLSYTNTFNMPVDSYMYIYFNITFPSTSGPVPSMLIEFDPDSTVTLTEESTYPETECKAFAKFEAGAHISRVITNQLDSFRSNYFGRTNSEPFPYITNGCGSYVALTNGFMIRGFPTTGEDARTIRMSMNDYFKGFNPIDNLGMGIEKSGDDYYIVVDKKEYFYDVNTVMLTLNNVPHIRRSEAPEYYYNRVKVGYDKWQIEYANGLDEFNSKREFDTGIKSVNNELDLISQLVASGYMLEVTRRKQFGETFTEDSEFDEENFIVCTTEDLLSAEKDENYVDVQNVISPETSYNLRISPARNLLRWSPVLDAGLIKNIGREIKFMSGEGNYKMTSEFDNDSCPGNWDNEELSEGQNIQWDDANNTDSTPIWVPEILEFEYPVTFSQFKAIEANPKGVFNVSESDEDHVKGFILEFKYKPGDKSQFKLLKAYV